ncbi:MAG: thiamine diphosphokinase [Coriobacteriia bacterium]|nr:thiamine diphosphokinase [Coriobacteriia bacterium]
MTTPSGVLVVGACPAPDAAPFYRALITAAGTVLAADGGLDVCLSAGRRPDISLGDFDSADPVALESVAAAGTLVVRFPSEKDATDLDLAIDHVRGMGAPSVTLTAAFSGRLDHTVAALGTLIRAADLGAVAVEPGMTAYALAASDNARVTLHLAADTVVSIIAFEPDTVVSAKGFRYPLRRTSLPAHSSLGVSNVVVQPSQTVTVHAGTAVVMALRTLDDPWGREPGRQVR